MPCSDAELDMLAADFIASHLSLADCTRCLNTGQVLSLQAWLGSLRSNMDETHRLYEDAVAKAVELDPLDAEAHAGLGFAF